MKHRFFLFYYGYRVRPSLIPSLVGRRSQFLLFLNARLRFVGAPGIWQRLLFGVAFPRLFLLGNWLFLVFSSPLCSVERDDR